jgi:hypothetical protein
MDEFDLAENSDGAADRLIYSFLSPVSYSWTK